MCGFIGEAGSRLDFDQDRNFRSALLRLGSRGPDGSGVFERPTVRLGHRRLSIIDPSERSSQPFRIDKLAMVLVFNGCIYNYMELRAELISLGYSFSTEGDTEVLLCAYHAWGADCLARFNGMFAFAIYDEAKNELFFARDRLGIKPAYYSLEDGIFRFASTLPSLVRMSGQVPAIDFAGLNFALNFRGTSPLGVTLLCGIRSLPPAHYCVFREEKLVMRRYWRLEEFYSSPRLSLSFDEAVESIRDLIDSAAMYRKNASDAKVGLFLSGGVDSSLLLSMLSRKEHLRTYSIGFESLGGEKGHEFEYSDLVSKTFETNHTKVRATVSDIINNLDECIRNMSEPMMSEDNIGFLLLSKRAAQDVRVVIGGQGADEFFGGYSWHPRMKEEGAGSVLYGALIRDRDHEDYCHLVDDACLGEDYSQQFLDEQFKLLGELDPVSASLFLDSIFSLPEGPLMRLDNMTMAAGLEGRVPYCDHRIVEFVAQCPREWLVGQSGKKILFAAGQNLVPEKILNRSKGSFPVPPITYLAEGMVEIMADTIKSHRFRVRGLFRDKAISAILESPGSYKTTHGLPTIWEVFVLERWFQELEKRD